MPSTTRSGDDLAAEIRRQTQAANRNNLTRTAAYLAFFRRHPEVEWALLAHFVSRNGGWQMTDLRGEWIPHLLSEEKIQSYFAFLERCNWLIFHDAYAQLLLYERMKQTGTDLTSLLPKLGVSRFMLPLWREFLQRENSQRLSYGLIINEQQYIQQRVVFHPFYQQNVLDSLPFRLQSLLSLQHVLFPYKAGSGKEPPRLAGLAVHRFPDVEMRIKVGKTLYHLLFDDKSCLTRFLDWACETRHTGSRADYWPHLFTSHQPDAHAPAVERIKGNGLLPGKPRLYSPPLPEAWPDTVQPAADGVDWFRDEKWIACLHETDLLPTLDEHDYVSSLNLLENGVLLKQKAGAILP